MAAVPQLRLKSAVTGLSEYFDERTYSKFGQISAYFLSKDESKLGFAPVDISPLNLAKLTAELLRFMDANLGVNAPKSARKTPKIPVRAFQDYSPHGSLQVILATVLRHFKSLRKADFSHPKRRDEYIQLFGAIDAELRRKGALQQVKVCCVQNVSRKSVEAIARRRSFVVTSPAEATHLIYPDPPGTTVAETQGMEYCRTLLLRGDMALVHWWYYPDSYDSWIPAAEVQGETEEEEDAKGPWHVQLRWLQDTETFNELMNETDYEIPDESRLDDEALAKVTHGAKHHHVEAANAAKKRPATKDRALDRQQSAAKATKLSSTGTANGGGGEATRGESTLSSSTGIKIRLKLPKMVTSDVQPHVVDQTGSAAVTSATTTTTLKTKTLPSSASSPTKSEPQLRGETLSSHAHALVDIVHGATLPAESSVLRVCNASWSTPTRSSASTSSSSAAALPRAKIDAQANASWFALDGIHAIERRSLPEFFSGRFALKTPRLYKEIRNKMVEAFRSSRQQYLSPSRFKLGVDADLFTVVRVHNFLEEWGIINHGARQGLRAGAAPVLATSSSSSAPGHGANKPSPSSPAGEPLNRCQACRQDVSACSWRCTASHVDFVLCPKCFGSGKYPAALSSRDFRKVVGGDAGGGNGWTDGELSLVLEAIANNAEDWEQIGDQSGSKKADACLAHFLRMPIEETIIERARMRRMARGDGPLAAEDIPFRNAKNPLMAQIAFLAVYVSMDVAAAAALAALKLYMHALSKRKDSGVKGTGEEQKGGANASSTVDMDELCKAALRESARRALLQAEVERRDAERFQAMATEVRLRELDLKLKRLHAIDQFLRSKLKSG